MSVAIGGPNVIDMENLVYVPGLDTKVIQLETWKGGYRALVYTRTKTPAVLGFFEYEFLSEKAHW